MTLTFEDAVHIARPQIVAAGDTARTRITDPTTSHMAADVSSAQLRATKVRVLQTILLNPGLTGSDLNDQYVFLGAMRNWPRVAWDTPRKRAGELAADGYLEMVDAGTRGRNNQPEHTYTLTDYGRQVVTLGKTVK